MQQIRRELAESDSDDSVIYRLYVRSRSEGFGTEVKRRIMLAPTCSRPATTRPTTPRPSACGD
nr:hypothetical protein [Rhodothermus marinus]